MKLSWLLFDLDNTLIDFNEASKTALYQGFDDFGMECDDEIYAIYKKINNGVWSDFEQGNIDAVTLRTRRFELLFEAIEISHITPIDFSTNYLNGIVHNTRIYEGVHDLLSELQGKYKISVVTNGLKEVQRPRLARLKMDHYFDSIIVSDEIGVAKPNEAFFKYAMNTIEKPPSKSETMIIGDNPISDIDGGNNFGIKTCLVTDQKDKDTSTDPDLIIGHVTELAKVLDI